MNRQEKSKPKDAARPILRSVDLHRLALELGKIIGQHVANDEVSSRPHRKERKSPCG